MTDRIENKTIKKLTSVGNVLKNPFKNLEEVLAQLGELDKETLLEEEVKEETTNFESQERDQGVTQVETSFKSEFESSNENLRKILTEIGEMFKICRTCGKQSLKDELISGICFDCNLKRERIHAENEDFITAAKDGDLIPLVGRIGDLEDQIRSMKAEKKPSKKVAKEYLSDIIEDVLKTVRKDIQIELKTIKKGFSSAQNPSLVAGISTAPPPPPPSSVVSTDNNILPTPSDIGFSNMNLTELKSFSPEFLDSLPLINRNQYNARIRELQQIERMTPEQKKKFFEKKAREQEQATNVKALKTSLQHLSESDNSLFLKMRKQAEKAILAGTGTLGNLGPKKVYIRCHVCGKTNDIIDICKHCKSSLNVR
jgi:Zn finger protein HypA/HybF involved in hydrogenase expression